MRLLHGAAGDLQRDRAAVAPAAGDEPGTLETLPAAHADERLAELGVLVERHPRGG